jgi:3-phenylpropionate/cinnamic acid dioxygenase small subunit
MTDEEGIRKTISQWSQFLDTRRFKEFSECFTEDAKWGPRTGRQAIYDSISKAELAQKPELRRKHLVSNFVIEVNGNEATSESDLVMFDSPRPGDPWFGKVGHYTDKLKKQADGRWLIAERKLQWME